MLKAFMQAVMGAYCFSRKTEKQRTGTHLNQNKVIHRLKKQNEKN